MNEARLFDTRRKSRDTMKAIKRVLYAAAMSVCLGGLLAQAATVTGTVMNKTTGKPAAGDKVALVDVQAGMAEVGQATTDAQGHYTLNTPGPGPYLIRVTHQGAGYFIAAPQGGGPGDIPVYDVAAKVDGVSIEADVMEKSFAKTDQTRANAAPVTAINPAIPARRAVSASRSGEIRAGCPVAISRNEIAPANRLYAASVSAIRSAKLPKAAISSPSRFSHAGWQPVPRPPASSFFLKHRPTACDLPHTCDGEMQMGESLEARSLHLFVFAGHQLRGYRQHGL